MQGVFIFILLFFGPFIYSQTGEIQSLKDSLASSQKGSEAYLRYLNTLSEAYVYVHADSMRRYAEEALDLSQELDNEYHYLYALQRIGVYHYYKAQFDSAEVIFRRGYTLARKQGMLERQGSYLGNIGLLMYSKSKLDSAVFYLAKAYEIDLALNDTLKMLVRLNNIGGLYSALEKPAKAINAFHKGFRYAKAIGDKNRIAYLAYNMSMIYNRYGIKEQALFYAKIAIENLDSANLGRPKLLVNIGEFYLSMDSLKQAQWYYLLAISDSLKGEQCQTAAAFVGLTDIAIRRGNIDSARRSFDQSHRFIQTCQDSFHLYNHAIIASRLNRLEGHYVEARSAINKAELYRNKHLSTYSEFEKEKSLLEERLGNYSEALRYSRIYNEGRDAFYKARYNEEVTRAELVRSFESEKESILKEQGLMRESLEKDISAFEDLRVIWSIASGFFIITIIVLAVSANRRKKMAFHFRKLNDIINQQKEDLQHKSEQLAVSNEKIKDLSEFRERLAAMAVHDMKGPLSTIIGLADGEMTDRKQKLIRKAGQQMLNFLMDLLDIYKFEKANIALQLHVHSIYKLIEEAKSSIYYIAEDKDISCDMKVPKDLLAPVDEGILVRVLTNLLSNAVKYSEPQSTVQVVAKEHLTDKGPKLLISITDQGLGLSEDQLEHMFKPMDFRKDVYISKSTSTGIGLDFCKLAIQAHRGKIWAESQKGVGTTVHIELPMVQDGERQVIHERAKEVVSEVTKLQDFKSQLRTLSEFKIHQAGKIIRVLQQMEEMGADPKWIAKLKASVYAADEARFYELVNKGLGNG